jgi:histidinol-phosphate aminotransferase
MLDTFSVKNITKPYMDYTLTNCELNTFLLKELSNNYDLCYFVNPSMPIGHILSHENIKHMLQSYPNTVFIIDEAYIEFSNNQTCAKFVDEFNNLIVVRTFSKFFSLASLRIGYLMTNNRFVSLLKPFYNYKDITKISVNCALSSLKNIDFYNKNKELYFVIKQYIIKNLSEIVRSNKKIKDYIFNEGMYFTLICHDPVDLKKYFDSFSIAVRNKDCDIKGAIRITVFDKESVEKVIEVLKKYS